jgi:futalosine hydrolase
VHILIVAATGAEVAPVVAALGSASLVEPRLSTYRYRDHNVDVLITGVGMVATAVWCSRALAMRRYGLVLNAGVCGSFTPSLPPGVVVHVISDRLAELGAQDGDEFLTIHELNLLGSDEFPFRGELLMNPDPPQIAALIALPSRTGITVNTVHGEAGAIARVMRRFDPDVESMEGAGFMYACLVAGQPFAQVRAVSNLVERRNRAAWKLREAIEALGTTTLEILEGA